MPKEDATFLQRPIEKQAAVQRIGLLQEKMYQRQLLRLIDKLGNA